MLTPIPETTKQRYAFMSIKPVWMLWISVDISGAHRVKFFMPFSLSVFVLLMDLLEDASALYSLFCSGKVRKNIDSSLPGGGIQNLLEIFNQVITELMLYTGPADLVDVDVTDQGKRVRVKCMLR